MKTYPVLLSIIIPAYNAADTILACVSSAQGEYGISHEVIVADDGSTDRTAELVEGAHFGNVRVLRCPHKGVSAARNAGLAEARGKWIYFADADDLVSMKEIAKMTAEASLQDDLIMFSYVEVSACGSETTIIPPLPEGRYSEREVFGDLADRLLDNSFAKKSVTRYMKGRVYQYLLSGRFLKNNELTFKEGLHFAEDCLFIYRCFLAATSMSVRKKIGYRRLYREGSAVHSYRPFHWEEYKMLLDGLTKALGRKPEKAAQLMYAGGNYVMRKAVRYFGTERKKESRKLLKKVLDDPVYEEAVRKLDFRNWTIKERIQNKLAVKHMYRLYWRWLWMQIR